MAFAVTHIILTIIILDFFRHYVFGLKKFPRYLLVIGGIAGLLPDIDIIFTWLYNFFTNSTTNLHGLFTHSFIFPLLLLLIALVFRSNKNTKWEHIFYVICAGWFIHLGIDWLFGEPKQFLWPLANLVYIPSWNVWPYSAHIDAILLVLWLVHEEIHHKIKDYF